MSFHKLPATVCFVFCSLIMFSAVSLIAGETEDLQKQLSELQKQREEIEGRYLQQKYSFVEEKQKARDELNVLENRARDLMERRNRMKEDIQGLKKDRADIAEKNEYSAMRVAETYSSYLALADKLKSFVKSHAPITSEHDYQQITVLRDNIENRKNMVVVARDMISFMNQLVEMSRHSAIYEDDILTEKGELTKGTRIRLGGVFYGYVTTDNKLSAILLRGSGLSAGEYRWYSQVDGSAERFRDFAAAVKGGDQFANIPFDVMQSQSTTKAVEGGSSVLSGFISWFKSGGLVMYAIVLVLLMTFFIIIERIIVFRKERMTDNSLIDPVLGCVKSGKMKDALNLCRDGEGPLARMLAAIMQERGASREDDYDRMQEVMLNEIPLVEKGLSTLKSLGALAPLLGLLGTVTGMIALFDVITAVGTGDPKLLAGGISEALVTTEFGLIVAIPAVLAYRLLQNRADSIINELERCGLTVLNHIWKSR